MVNKFLARMLKTKNKKLKEEQNEQIYNLKIKNGETKWE